MPLVISGEDFVYLLWLVDFKRHYVYMCPEPTCLHHDARHALGDLVGIKKHYRRMHSNNKQWVWHKCSKGYAVQSNYKAHVKICGTHGHSCDCGCVFSRVESFIENQDVCAAKPPLQHPVGSSTTPSAPSLSSDTNFSMVAPLPMSLAISPSPVEPPSDSSMDYFELQLLPSSAVYPKVEDFATSLRLSIGPCSTDPKSKLKAPELSVSGVVNEELKLAMAEKDYAEEKRQETRRQIELAELEFVSAKRLRQEAKAELDEAERLMEQATKKISALIIEITCHVCKQKFSS